jgi:hypothetical protein
MDDQGCPEAHRLHGSLEQIYLPTWRMRITLLKTAQAPPQVPVDRGGNTSAAKSQVSFAVAPILTAPQPGENLLLYITVTTHIISTAIVVECQEEGHAFSIQRPAYFSKKSFLNPRFVTRQFRNYSTIYSSPAGSIAIISMHTTSWWSAMAEPSKLIQLKCTNHHHRGNPG